MKQSYTSTRSTPFLLRFLSPLDQPTLAFRYDQREKLNVISGQNVPAVRAGVEVKTLGAVEDTTVI